MRTAARHAIAAALITISTASCANSPAPPFRPAESYAALDAAISKRSVSGVSALLTWDFQAGGIYRSHLSFQYGAPFNKRVALESISQLPHYHNVREHYTILSVQRSNRTATVRERFERDVPYAGKIGTLGYVSFSTDVWVVDHGTWKIRSTTTTGGDLLVNGKHQRPNLSP